MSTLFRLRYEVQGGHTHVRVFAGKGDEALGLCGNLVFRNEEWDDFQMTLARSYAGVSSSELQIVNEANHVPEEWEGLCKQLDKETK